MEPKYLKFTITNLQFTMAFHGHSPSPAPSRAIHHHHQRSQLENTVNPRSPKRYPKSGRLGAGGWRNGITERRKIVVVRWFN
jgi:hypothetical protein